MKETTQSLPVIRLNDREAIFGRTGTGKSILAHYLYRSVPVPHDKEETAFPFWVICIDVSDSVWDDALTFTDPTNIPWDQSYRLRFVPDVEVLESAIDTLYQNIILHGNCWVWLDEANEVSTAHRTIIGLRKVLLRGRKEQIGHCSATPRPADISRSILSQADHFFMFALSDPDDRLKLAKRVNMTLEEFDYRIASLPEFGYLWYDVRQGVVYEMPPLPLEIVETLE
jgi:hypothetical protein